MAARYIAAVREVQPEGPYLLGGWSFGGLVAFEMGQQLRHQGAEVLEVVLIDTAAPASGSDPPSSDGCPAILEFALDLSRRSGNNVPDSTALMPLVRGEATTRAEQFDRVFAFAQSADVLPPDAGPEQLRYAFEVYAANVEAMRSYVAAPYPGRLTLFKAIEAADGSPGTAVAAAWQNIASGPVRIREVPGDHYTALIGARARVLADGLRGVLDAADAEPEASLARAQREDGHGTRTPARAGA
jgi:thioesterase domain-containing protein